VNAVTSQVGDGDGGGSYFDLHTGSIGFGIKVDHETMAVYLKRFGVPQEMIDGLPLKVPKTKKLVKKISQLPATCVACSNEASKRCDQCRLMPYCSDKCQRSDWKTHKWFCRLAPFPDDAPTTPGRATGIVGILLPASAKEPELVEVPWKEVVDEDDGQVFHYPNVEEFLGAGFIGEIRSDYLPSRPFAHLPHSLHLKFRDRFMVDGSEENRCIANLLGEERSELAAAWRGNIVVLKAVGGGNDPHFVNMGLRDTHDIVEFIFQYGLAKLTSANK